MFQGKHFGTIDGRGHILPAKAAGAVSFELAARREFKEKIVALESDCEALHIRIGAADLRAAYLAAQVQAP